ncbi:MAG: hypothetical protein IT385_24610 [Deltaproteobacteria bacterium]|nr:hypothetical protein [Deltaproteobacteria bacterium]
MRLGDLLRELEDDTEERVRRAGAAHNEAIRGALGDDLLRFKLTWRSGREAGRVARYASASITYEPIMADIALRELPTDDAVAALLSLWGPDIHHLARGVAGVRRLLDQWGARLTELVDVPRAIGTLEQAGALVDSLDAVRRGGRFDLIAWLHAGPDDALGCWRYMGDADGPDGYATSVKGEISLYCGAIGLCAKALAAPVETLTVITLAHELAHAYTHLGFDRDGERWRCDAFAICERELKEGLAQLYTFWILHRLEASGRVRELVPTFLELMSRQPAPYRMHLPWLDLGATPEAVATALARVRRRGAASHDEFTRALRSTLDERRGRGR